MFAALRETPFVRSFRKNLPGILLMFFSAVITALAQFLWKVAGAENLLMVLAGVALYGFSSVLMIVAFRFGSLSVLHPIMAVSYVVGLSLGVIFLKETIPTFHLLGVLTIILGVILIGGGDA